MAESADEVYERVAGVVGADGRLPLPSVTERDVFPWEVEGGRLVPKHLAPPRPEAVRMGEGDRPCPSCGPADPEWGRIWENDRWVVKRAGERGGLPLVLLLETKEHVDFTELDEDLAADYGRLSIRLARIMEGLPNIGRVHLGRWGEGGSHFHVWFLARTAGLPSVRGSYAADWDDILPPGPEDVWRADVAAVARKLATHEGRALV